MLQNILIEPSLFVPNSSKINIDAIMYAYRIGELEIKPGLVTYWIDGKLVSDYVVEDFEEVCRLCADADAKASAFYREKK